MKDNSLQEIRVVAPSKSWAEKREGDYGRAMMRLRKLGYIVTFGENVRDDSYLGSAPAKKRAEDLMAAYCDQNVVLIVALDGGWLANAVLPYLDWEVIRQNPKPLMGYSDITVLLDAIYAKTGVAGYYGPNLGTLGYQCEAAYTLDYVQKLLNRRQSIPLRPSTAWGVGNGRKRYRTSGWKVLQGGAAEGVALGGNLGTFYLLQGTEYMPAFDRPTILCIEDDDEPAKFTLREFDRRFESILQQPGVRENLCGLLIGRFCPKSKVDMADVQRMVASKNLGDIPVIADVDFGHTLPMVVLPVGGRIRVCAADTPGIEILTDEEGERDDGNTM